MKSLALIRTTEIDADVERLENELRPFFGDSIFHVVDRYSEQDTPALRIQDKTILVSQAFLEMRGLPWFPGVGWQCGDFMYYAAAEALPDYDFYWLIESDVSIRTNVKNFFEGFNDFEIDSIGANFSRRGKEWYWYKSVYDLADGDVYGSLFPISRMSRRAAMHLLDARANYSALPYVREQTWAAGRKKDYANDEAFVSTVLMRDGFSCQSLESLIPPSMMSDFTATSAIHPEELSFVKNRIIHPVCAGNKAKTKLKQLEMHNFPALKIRMEEFSSRLGADRWEEFSGISRAVIEGQITPIAQPSFDVPLPLSPLAETLNMRLDALRPQVMSVKKPAQFVMTWLFEDRIAVLDFLIFGQRIAFDVSLDSTNPHYKLEVLARDPGGVDLLGGLNCQQLKPARYLVGKWFDDVALEDMDQDIARSILDVIAQITNAASRRKEAVS
jgi:hypothetical protein